MNQKLEDDIKKRRTNSNTYAGVDWMYGAQDSDTEWRKEWEEYTKHLSEKWKTPTSGSKTCCSSPQKYKNGMGKMLFWSCKNCGADLGDVND